MSAFDREVFVPSVNSKETVRQKLIWNEPLNETERNLIIDALETMRMMGAYADNDHYLGTAGLLVLSLQRMADTGYLCPACGTAIRIERDEDGIDHYCDTCHTAERYTHDGTLLNAGYTNDPDDTDEADWEASQHADPGFESAPDCGDDPTEYSSWGSEA